MSDRLDTAREWYGDWLAIRPHRDLTTSHGVIGLLADYAASKDERIAQLERERDQAIEALRPLVEKLRVILPKVDSLCTFAWVHNMPYDGPNIVEEMKDAERVLAETAIKGGK